VQGNSKDFIRYLKAKKPIDDRSLNYQVWRKTEQIIRELQGSGEIRVLDIGCGIGTMLERMLDGRMFTNTVYTGVDIKPELVSEAKARLRKYAGEHGFAVREQSPDVISLHASGRTVIVRFVVSDIFDFVASHGEAPRYDILAAHAFMDLVDPTHSMPLFLSLLRHGGLTYFTLNFDGMTVFEPTIGEGMDALVVSLYHETMNNRLVNGRPSGNSFTGRLLPRILRNCGVETLVAGSSDWVLIPGARGYDKDEAFFLHFIINTVRDALSGHPGMDANALSWWIRKRHDQIEDGELTYIAHQIDILGRLTGTP
jgi:SAM-dependent methyltransferase